MAACFSDPCTKGQRELPFCSFGPSRQIYHFKPERIQAHIGLCYQAFSLTRHAQQRIKLAQHAMSVERIRDALTSVQASILEHVTTGAKYRMPSAFSPDAARIYRAFGLSRSISPSLA